MGKPRQPRSLDAAARLLERFAELDAGIALSNQVRDSAIAEANRLADTENAPLIEERDNILAVLEPWWAANAASLLSGDRKTVELGGCILGTRKDKPSLAVEGEPKDLVSKLLKTRWGKALVRISASLDRRAIFKALEGKWQADLEELGFSRDEGADRFIIERVTQDGARK